MSKPNSVQLVIIERGIAISALKILWNKVCDYPEFNEAKIAVIAESVLDADDLRAMAIKMYETEQASKEDPAKEGSQSFEENATQKEIGKN